MGLAIEVGTGDGTWAWAMAEQGYTVHTFEPSTIMRDIAYARLGELERVTLMPYAIGGNDRPATLYRCNGQAASLHYQGEPHEGCTVVSMNHWFVYHRIGDVDLLYLDCNGSEYEILEQMIDCDLLRRVGQLRIVWNGNEVERKAKICEAIARTHEPPDGGAAWERKQDG